MGPSDWVRDPRGRFVERLHTLEVRKDLILHMGLPWSVSENGAVVARFPDRRRAVDYASEIYQQAGGSLGNVEFIIERRTV